MPNVTTLSTFRPRSTRLTLNRLLAKRPAATSSAIESAICAVASEVRKRAAAARARRLAGLALERRRRRSGRVLCSAGKRPKSRPVPSVSAAGEEQHRSRRARAAATSAASGGSSDAISVERPPRDEQAGERRRARRARSDSVSSCAISCRRLAPSDSRTAISPARAARARQQQVGDVRARDEQHDRR